MKKVVIAVIILLFIPIKVNAISAESYIVMDADSKRVLGGHNYEKEKLIASITKIMTCIIALENSDVNKIVKVGEEVLKAHGSAIYIGLNEEISLNDLLYGLMLRSGNDAAIEIAYAVSGDMEKFVKVMNDKAYELGMSNTLFLNNHGLEENDGNGNKSTSYDMALLMSYAIKNEKFREIIKTENHVAKSNQKTYSWANKNKLLDMYEYNIGGKTGYTQKAKRTLVTASIKDDKKLVVVTLNDGNDFENHKNLYEEYFEKYNLYKVLDKDSFSLTNDTYDNLYLKNDFNILLTDEEHKSLRVDYEIKTDSKTEEVGTANIYLNDKLVGSEKLFTKEKEEKEEKVGFLKRFFRWLFKW